MSPESITWSNDGRSLFLVTEDEGISRLFESTFDGRRTRTPKATDAVGIYQISNVKSLGADWPHLFLSGSSLVDNSRYSVLDPTESAEGKVVFSNSRNGSSFGLSSDQVTDIWFQGTKGQVHAWVMRPSNFSSDMSYPLAFLIHGGR